MLPDFLFIGAPRTASTWLYLNLRLHPDVWVPPTKSVHYFHERFHIYRGLRIWREWRDAFRKNSPDDANFYRHYFLAPWANDAWYEKLFPDNPNLIKGEIGEAYSSVGPEKVAHIKRLMPDVKIIFMMRNPWDRALSHASQAVKRIKNPSEDLLLQQIDSTDSEKRTYYTRTLEIWEQHFPQDQFLIGFFDDMQADPFTYLERICTFLNADYKREYFEHTAPIDINKAGRKYISDELTHYAVKKYAEEVDRLASRFGGKALDWQKETQKILSDIAA